MNVICASPVRVRRATVLRYGGSLWVNGYWPRTTLSIELRPVGHSHRRVILIGPSFGAGRSIAVDLAADVGPRVLADALAAWIEVPALSVRHAEHRWPEAARRLASDLAIATAEAMPA